MAATVKECLEFAVQVWLQQWAGGSGAAAADDGGGSEERRAAAALDECCRCVENLGEQFYPNDNRWAGTGGAMAQWAGSCFLP